MAKTRTETTQTKTGETEVTAAMIEAGNKLLENWVAVSTELLEFSRARLNRNLEVSKALASSSSIDEAIGLHSDFTRTTLQDYFAAASKLADLSTKALLAGFSSWQSASRDAGERRTAA